MLMQNQQQGKACAAQLEVWERKKKMDISLRQNSVLFTSSDT
jgi:hypothetical protein